MGSLLGPVELAPAYAEGLGSGSGSCEGLGDGTTATFSSWSPQPPAEHKLVALHLHVRALPGSG